jgi:hypothetical protein
MIGGTSPLQSMTIGQNVQSPGYVNYPDSSPILPSPLLMISGLPVTSGTTPAGSAVLLIKEGDRGKHRPENQTIRVFPSLLSRSGRRLG